MVPPHFVLSDHPSSSPKLREPFDPNSSDRSQTICFSLSWGPPHFVLSDHLPSSPKIREPFDPNSSDRSQTICPLARKFGNPSTLFLLTGRSGFVGCFSKELEAAQTIRRSDQQWAALTYQWLEWPEMVVPGRLANLEPSHIISGHSSHW